MKQAIITARVPATVRQSLKQQADKMGMKFSAFIARILCERAKKENK